jgi:hypothetical protein
VSDGGESEGASAAESVGSGSEGVESTETLGAGAGEGVGVTKILGEGTADILAGGLSVGVGRGLGVDRRFSIHQRDRFGVWSEEGASVGSAPAAVVNGCGDGTNVRRNSGTRRGAGETTNGYEVERPEAPGRGVGIVIWMGATDGETRLGISYSGPGVIRGSAIAFVCAGLFIAWVASDGNGGGAAFGTGVLVGGMTTVDPELSFNLPPRRIIMEGIADGDATGGGETAER